MHYLIQKTTRQHIAVADDMPCPVECVKVVADADGWVRYRGERCPVPFDDYVDVICNSGVQIGGVWAPNIDWNNITKYRPLMQEIEGAEDYDDDLLRPRRMPSFADGLDHVPRQADDRPPATAPIHDTAAMLLCIICAFALGALIGWGWM